MIRVIFVLNVLAILALAGCQKEEKGKSQTYKEPDSLIPAKGKTLKNEADRDKEKDVIEVVEKFENIARSNWIGQVKHSREKEFLYILDSTNFKEYSSEYMDTLKGTYKFSKTKDTLFLYRKQRMNTNDNPNKPDHFYRLRNIAILKGGHIVYQGEQLPLSGGKWSEIKRTNYSMVEFEPLKVSASQSQ